MSEPVSLAQIVAALSVSYSDEGVLIWLNSMRATWGPGVERLAHMVRRIGDADPADFVITDRRVSGTTGKEPV